MEVGWKRAAFVICGVGLLKEFYPSAPFFVEYAIEHTNFTSDEVNREILPVTIYGHFVSLLIFLLITDLLRYKPIILLGGVCAVACWAVTIFSYDRKIHGITRQILYSIEHSSEVAYLTFMYEIVNRTYYKEITSLVHGSMHAGKFVGGALGQILLSYKILTLDRLNYISFGASVGVIAFATFLPNIDWSLYWHPPKNQSISAASSTLDLEKGDTLAQQEQHDEPGKNECAQQEKKQDDIGKMEQHQQTGKSYQPCPVPFSWRNSINSRFSTAFSELRKDIVNAYTNGHVARWSVWWALSRAIYWQIALFTESLWKQIEEETHEHPLNGAVDAGHALISTLLAASVPYVKVPWEMWAESYLALIALIQGFMTLWMSQTQNLYIANMCYVIVQTTFEVVFIFGASEIAGSLPDHKASFIFGINALGGILIQAVITNIITTSYSLALDIRQQFFVYGFYSIALSFVFLAFALRRRHKTWRVNGTMEKGLTRF